MSIYHDAQRAGFEGMAEVAGEQVAYKFGTHTLTRLNVLRGETKFENESPSGFGTETTTVDWLVKPEHFVDSNGDRTEPKIGHQLVTQSGDVFDTFPGANDKCWRWSDQFETYLRIHSVRRVKS